MKKIIQSLLIAMLLIVSTLPTYAVEIPDGIEKEVYSCEGKADGTEVPSIDGCNTCICEDGEIASCTEMACTSGNVFIPSSPSQDVQDTLLEEISSEDLMKHLKEIKERLREDAFWISLGESRVVIPEGNPNLEVNIEYMGTENTCELLNIHYAEKMGYPHLSVQENDYQSYEVEIGSGQVEPQVVETQAVEVEPNFIETEIQDILGDEINEVMVEEDEINEVKLKDEDSISRKELLENNILSLSKKVYNSAYVTFTTDQKEVREALTKILIDLGVGRYNPKQLEEFIKLNNINVDEFFDVVKKAQDEMAMAQIHLYNAWNYLSNNQLDAAELEYNDAVDEYDNFVKTSELIRMEYLEAWKPLPNDEKSGDAPLPVTMPVSPGSDVETVGIWNEILCLKEDDLGLAFFLYEKKDDRILIALNPSYYPTAIIGVTVSEQGFLGEDGFVITDVVEPSDIQTMQATKGVDVASGCRVNGKVMPVGTRFIAEKGENEIAMYCDWEGKVLPQKEEGDKASNGYECLSGEERNGECRDTLNFLQKIWNFIFG